MEKVKGGGFKRRILIQTALAVAFFFLVAAFVSADNFLGEGARYVAGEGVDVESSWVSFDDGSAVEVSADPAQETEGTPRRYGGGRNGAPLYRAGIRIVVTDLAVAVSGFSTEQGILIQGSAGQNVKAAADGEVRYLGESEDGYMVELLHSGGFTSIYQGLSSIEVGYRRYGGDRQCDRCYRRRRSHVFPVSRWGRIEPAGVSVPIAAVFFAANSQREKRTK